MLVKSATFCREHVQCVPLFDYIAENPHHGHCLLLRETLIFQSLHKFERVEMMVLLLRTCCTERPATGQNRCDALRLRCFCSPRVGMQTWSTCGMRP